MRILDCRHAPGRCAEASSPPDAPTEHPVLTLGKPGALSAIMNQAGLRIVDEGSVACPFVYASYSPLIWLAAGPVGR